MVLIPEGRLTMPSSQVAGMMDKLDLFLIQACQCSQVLVFAIFRERVDALVTVMEVCEQDVCACLIPSQQALLCRMDRGSCVTHLGGIL
jgi:hypothetical protein